MFAYANTATSTSCKGYILSAGQTAPTASEFAAQCSSGRGQNTGLTFYKTPGIVSSCSMTHTSNPGSTAESDCYLGCRPGSVSDGQGGCSADTGYYLLNELSTDYTQVCGNDIGISFYPSGFYSAAGWMA